MSSRFWFLRKRHGYKTAFKKVILPSPYFQIGLPLGTFCVFAPYLLKGYNQTRFEKKDKQLLTERAIAEHKLLAKEAAKPRAPSLLELFKAKSGQTDDSVKLKNLARAVQGISREEEERGTPRSAFHKVTTVSKPLSRKKQLKDIYEEEKAARWSKEKWENVRVYREWEDSDAPEKSLEEMMKIREKQLGEKAKVDAVLDRYYKRSTEEKRKAALALQKAVDQ